MFLFLTWSPAEEVSSQSPPCVSLSTLHPSQEVKTGLFSFDPVESLEDQERERGFL